MRIVPIPRFGYKASNDKLVSFKHIITIDHDKDCQLIIVTSDLFEILLLSINTLVITV